MENVILRPSGNFDLRRLPLTMLIVHYTDMASAEAALARLTDNSPDNQAKVSAHYLIDTDGTIYQMVAEVSRAWHAGAAQWRGITDINSASIGIELQHSGHAADNSQAAFPPAQMQSFVALAKEIIARHNIAPQNIIGHSDVAPTRKRDPGEAFDWQALSREGLGVWVELNSTPSGKVQNAPLLKRGDTSPATLALQNNLAAYGYNINCDGVFGEQTEQIVISFCRHFNPQEVNGTASPRCQQLAAQLAALT